MINQARRWLLEAIEHHKAGRRDDAERLYKNVLQVEPKNIDALHFLGVLRTDRQDWEGGLPLMHKALEISPKNATFHFNLGSALRRKGDLEPAIESYRRAIKLAPAVAEVVVRWVAVAEQVELHTITIPVTVEVGAGLDDVPPNPVVVEQVNVLTAAGRREQARQAAREIVAELRGGVAGHPSAD